MGVCKLKEPIYDPTKEIDPGDLVKCQSTNARLWAKSFMDTIDANHWDIKDIDEGLMISWFATVIETTKDRMNYDEDQKNRVRQTT